jgi:hypothetical protein
MGLSTAWLSGGGEAETAADLRKVLGAPEPLIPYATIPIGWPHRRSDSRWRRSLDDVVHWNHVDASRVRTAEDITRYVEKERRDSIYRDAELRESLLASGRADDAAGDLSLEP